MDTRRFSIDRGAGGPRRDRHFDIHFEHHDECHNVPQA